MRTIGFSSALVLYLTIFESALLCVVGGAVGCAATLFITKVLPFAFLPLGPIDLLAIISPEVKVILQAFVLSIAIGAVAGLIPALGSVRRPVVESIRAISYS